MANRHMKKKMFRFTHQQENVNKNYNVVSPHPSKNGKATNVNEAVGERYRNPILVGI